MFNQFPIRIRPTSKNNLCFTSLKRFTSWSLQIASPFFAKAGKPLFFSNRRQCIGYWHSCTALRNIND